jgi:hypothetical protein
MFFMVDRIVSEARLQGKFRALREGVSGGAAC